MESASRRFRSIRSSWEVDLYGRGQLEHNLPKPLNVLKVHVLPVIRNLHRGHVFRSNSASCLPRKRSTGYAPSLLKQRRVFLYGTSRATKLRQVHPFSKRNCLVARLTLHSTLVTLNPISREATLYITAQIFHSASLIYIRTLETSLWPAYLRKRILLCMTQLRRSLRALRVSIPWGKVEEENL